MLTADELYNAAVIRTNEEWDAVCDHLCGIISSVNFIKIMNMVGEVALKLPYGSYPYNRVMYVYDKLDAVAKNKAALGVF